MFKEVYIYNEESNEYIGESITMLDPEETRMQGKDVWMMPPNSTTVKPELKEGYASIWSGSEWTHVEDHRGKKGFINGVFTEIKELGPLPEGFIIRDLESTQEEKPNSVKLKLLAKIFKLEQASSKALNEITKAQLTGKEVTEEEINNFIEYETRANALRSELAAVGE